jgi:hypothetical protein
MGPQGFQNPKFKLGEFRPLHILPLILLLHSKIVKRKMVEEAVESLAERGSPIIRRFVKLAGKRWKCLVTRFDRSGNQGKDR